MYRAGKSSAIFENYVRSKHKLKEKAVEEMLCNIREESYIMMEVMEGNPSNDARDTDTENEREKQRQRAKETQSGNERSKQNDIKIVSDVAHVKVPNNHMNEPETVSGTD